MRDIEMTISTIGNWVRTRESIRAFALVGSYARGDARPDSDIDLLFLTTDPGIFRADWLDEINWAALNVQPVSSRDKSYGVVWSRHVAFSDGSEIEFTFTPLSWSTIDPVDLGTHHVVADGFKIFHDPDNRLATLQSVIGAPET